MKWQPVLAVAVALAVGIAGYGVVGSPTLPARPTARADPNPDLTPEAEQASKTLLENFGDVRAWLTLSDALIRAERTETAIVALESGLEAIPGNADLWVQMGVALVAHANGEVVPAARLAFDRASRLAPDHPGPPYFLGLAWMQSGETERALKVWGELKARSTADAPWLPMLDRQIAVAVMMQKMGSEPGQTPPGMMPMGMAEAAQGEIEAP
ncbi:MAG: tetratricopeptide repeat protein [Sandaracinobacteroides sp.]